MKHILRIFLHLTCLGTLFGLLVVSAAVLYLEPTLPPAREIQNIDLQIPMRIYTNDDKLMGEFGEKRRSPIAFEEIPDHFVHAVVAAEDANFFEHIGIDIKGLTRAAVLLVTTRKIQGGGSTITMQLAKNYFFTFEQLFSRKFREILLAFKLEQQLSKEKIFELYVNKIFYGKRSYGAQAAANSYYGKNLQELSTAQLAMIAGIPKAPSAYNPIANPDRALQRRDWILNRMAKLGYIDSGTLTASLAQPLSASLHGAVVELDAPYVAEMVRGELIERYGTEIYSKGVSVYTTIDSQLQSRAQAAIQRGLEAYDQRHGYRGPEGQIPPQANTEMTTLWLKALGEHHEYSGHIPAIISQLDDDRATLLFKDGSIDFLLWENVNNTRKYISEARLSSPAEAIDELLSVGDLIRVKRNDAAWELSQIPNIQGTLVSLNANNGAIQSLVGGYDFYLSNFNRATQAIRQPGSNFKPFMYAYAMESGFTPASIINDAPIVFKDEGLENLWRPDNASNKFYGPTPLRKALYLSRNVVSVRLMQALGVSNVAEFVENFGFDQEQIPRNLSLALGTMNASPLDIARAYAVFANGGYLINPYIIEKVVDGDGNIIEEANPAVVCKECENTRQTNAEETVEDDFDALGFEELLNETAPEDAQPPQNIAPRVVDARSIYLIDSILQDTVRRGTAWRAKSLGRSDLAGKTGTTNGPTDAWFSGYKPGLVTTAWVGFDSFDNLGSGEYGGAAALPIWIDYMEMALANIPEEPRTRPSGIVSTLIDPETGLRVSAGTPGAKFELFRDDNLPKFKPNTLNATFESTESSAPAALEESALF